MEYIKITPTSLGRYAISQGNRAVEVSIGYLRKSEEKPLEVALNELISPTWVPPSFHRKCLSCYKQYTSEYDSDHLCAICMIFFDVYVDRGLSVVKPRSEYMGDLPRLPRETGALFSSLQRG